MCWRVGESVVWCAQHGVCVCDCVCTRGDSVPRSSAMTEKHFSPENPLFQVFPLLSSFLSECHFPRLDLPPR